MSQTPEEIEADIARQREELAATVTELQSRLDVKGRAKAKAADLKDNVQDTVTTDSGSPRPDLLIGAVVVVAAIVGLVVWRRHRA